jgi:hypothetical protein
MINYHYKVWEYDRIWTADIYANSDCLLTINEYASEHEATIAAESFIDGIKFGRGE